MNNYGYKIAELSKSIDLDSCAEKASYKEPTFGITFFIGENDTYMRPNEFGVYEI